MADFKKLKDGQGNFYNVKDETARTNLASHTGNTSNPHSVTKAQVGLGNVDNTSDANKPISNAQAAVNETKFDKANVKATPASTPSNDNVVSEKYSEETYAKKDGYYETFGYAREAGIASNLKNDEGKLLDPDVETSSGTVYADQPFTQRATAMTMNAYLNNELITVGSGYEQWKKEQAFSVVRNQIIKNGNFADTSENWYNSSVSKVIANNTLTFTVNQDVGGGASIYVENDYNPTPGHKFLMSYKAKVSRVGINLGYGIGGTYRTTQFFPTDTNWHVYCEIDTFTSDDVYKYIYIGNCSIGDEVQFRDYQVIDLTQFFASRPEIAEALNGDAGIKWFLQNYPDYTGYVDYDEGTIVDTEDYEYQTTGVNLWDEEWELGSYNTTNGEKITDNSKIRNKNPIRVLGNTTYNKLAPDNSVYWLVFYDINMNYIENQGINYGSNTFTTPLNACYMNMLFESAYGTTYKHDIQICNHFTETSVEQTYHKYEIFKDRVSWAFTSTGKGKSAGKVADTKDYVNKKNIEKVGRVDLGTLDWSILNNTYVADISNIKINNVYQSSSNLTCSKYSTISCRYRDEVLDKTITKIIDNRQVGIKDSDYTTVETFKAAMSGVYLNYELATPIETDMTGDELDTNIPENDYGVERKVPVSGNMFSGSSTTIFYQDNVLRQIYNNKTSIDNLQGELTIEETTRSDTDTALQNAIGGTLRQCLCVKENLDFDNTAFVDLGELTWVYEGSVFGANLLSVGDKGLSTKYKRVDTVATENQPNNTIQVRTNIIYIKDATYTDATTFKNAMKGVLLAYGKATE